MYAGKVQPNGITLYQSDVPNLVVIPKLASIMQRYGLGNLQETYNALYLEKARLQNIVDCTKKAEQAFAHDGRTRNKFNVRNNQVVVN